MNQTKQTMDTGTAWEQLAGYSRAVRIGDRILVSGTTATAPDGQPTGANDPAAQTRYVLNKIESAIRALGGRMNDVVCTRVYVRDIAD